MKIEIILFEFSKSKFIKNVCETTIIIHIKLCAMNYNEIRSP